MKRLSALLAVSTAAALGLTALVATPAAAADPITIAAVRAPAPRPRWPADGHRRRRRHRLLRPPSNYRGLYLEAADPAAEGPEGASDGIFVFFNAANPAVAIGDLVQVTGTASEFQDQTQITATAAANYTVVEAGAGVPAPVAAARHRARRRPRAVRGHARAARPAPTCSRRATSSSTSARSGSAPARPPSRPPRPPMPGRPTPIAIAADNAARRILLDDGYSIRVDAAAHVGDQPYFTKDTVVRNGDILVPPAKPMVLGYGFDDWRLQPQVPMTDASDAAYKPTLHRGEPAPGCRTRRRRRRPVRQLQRLQLLHDALEREPGRARRRDGRAVRHPEVEDRLGDQRARRRHRRAGGDREQVELGETVDEALADLVAALNAAAGAGTWAYVPTPAVLATPGATDFITTAIIYKPARADPVGDSFADIDDVWDIAREPIAQTFDVGQPHGHGRREPPQVEDPADGRRHRAGRRPGLLQRRARRAGEPPRRRVGDISADERPRATTSSCSATSTPTRGGPDPGVHRGRAASTWCPTRPRASTPTPSTASSARSTTRS